MRPVSRLAALGALLGLSTLAACGSGSRHEHVLPLLAVKAALRATDLRHFDVVVAAPPSDIEVYGEPLTKTDGVWMYLRVFPTVRAANDSTLVAEYKKDFPAEDKFDLTVCNVWLSPAAPSSLLANERLNKEQAKAIRSFEAALVRARDRLADELRRRCT